MMDTVRRVFVEKKAEYAIEAQQLQEDIKTQLHIALDSVRIMHRYDVQGVTDDIWQDAIGSFLSEPMVDQVWMDTSSFKSPWKFAVELLPGQYDQRADSCMQCFAILAGVKVQVRCAKVYILQGMIDENELLKIQHYIINPVDQRIAAWDTPSTIEDVALPSRQVPTITGFIDFGLDKLKTFYTSHNMAMSYEDLVLIQSYFQSEERDPTETELKVLDTYWSDHCRHTTFSTILSSIILEESNYKTMIKQDIADYQKSRQVVYGNNTTRPVTLMDLATIAMKELRMQGRLNDLEISDEINACSLEVTVQTEQGEEPWLLMFKNETHNHPTEIEPYGGAATCLGGAIRDPLSGRAYVYQAMRISGAGDPRQSIISTRPGKLPQRKICQEAAHGYASYGNQIGIATGYVHELYDPGYEAKRMELGAVVAAAPKKQVLRLQPMAGDIVLLIGGRTGRDGIGGATGSSKSHKIGSMENGGAEVQKGNPVEERKIQRLFRQEEVANKIIRCNDFGAGGICVAVGELADGLDIDLDSVLTKCQGMTGTELAISESQERMAIVIKTADLSFFQDACAKENLEVSLVARVTESPRLLMRHRGHVIVDLARDFLDSAGAKRTQDVFIESPKASLYPFVPTAKPSFKETMKEVLSRLSVASQKGLVERFDASIGNASVLFPYGGKTYRTETEGMVALLPVQDSVTTTASIMAYGYSPTIAKWSPYHGAIYAVMESLSKIVAMGGDYRKVRFSFQEYFEKLLDQPQKWGKPLAALLGAYHVQRALSLPAVGGKDSMSGSFEDLHVPPTLVSFAITTQEVDKIISPELKEANHILVEICLHKDNCDIFDFDHVKQQYDALYQMVENKRIYSAYTIKDGGVLEAVSKMAFGNEIGVAMKSLPLPSLVQKDYGNIIIEVASEGDILCKDYRIIGTTTDTNCITYGSDSITLDQLYEYNSAPLESVYPTKMQDTLKSIHKASCYNRGSLYAKQKIDEPLVIIPVFPGTNCEYDLRDAFIKAGAKVEFSVICNTTETMLANSITSLELAIHKANIIVLPGGFSAGDEPEGSGKFIATILRHPSLQDAIHQFLERDGLMMGICNGFQALIKLGLLPYGKIQPMQAGAPTLTFNTIGRHVSQMVTTRIGSVQSPWLSNVSVGDVHTIPVSHGEGRFVGPDNVIQNLFDNGQVFSQYVDSGQNPTMHFPDNPNGSMQAIEGILSPDGHIIGKMGHSERQGNHRLENIYGDKDQQMFLAGVQYFKGR